MGPDLVPDRPASPAEQRVGGGTVAGRELVPAARPGDLRLQGGDAGFELGDRQGVEVLARKLRQEVGAAGGKVVRLHFVNVDRAGRAVNNVA